MGASCRNFQIWEANDASRRMDVLLQQASEGEELALLAEFTGESFVKLEIGGGDGGSRA